MSEHQNEVSETPEAAVVRLQALLKAEHEKVTTLQAEAQSMRVHQVQMLASAEAQEEYITNMLLKRLEAITTERDQLVSRVAVIQKEREALVLQLEQEEEYLTNTLQKKLTTVLREKIELENQLEQEEEYIVNELQKKLSKLQAEKAELEARLLEERESHETLRRTQSQLAKAQQQNQDLHKELASVRSENFGLTQKIAREQKQNQAISQAKAQLELGLEMDDERAFNMELARSEGPGGGGGRHRTRSQSLPVREGEATTPLQADVTTISPSSSSRLVKSNSGSSGLNASSSPSSDSSSSPTSQSPPTSPRNSLDTRMAGSAPTMGTGNTRSRRLSIAANASLMHHYPSTPRSTATILKQGWMRSTPCSKVPSTDPDLDPEPATDLYFILSDDSTLSAWMNELHSSDGSSALYSINLDTVMRRQLDAETGELVLETKEYIYTLRPQSEDTKEWFNLLQQLDPLASGSSTPSH